MESTGNGKSGFGLVIGIFTALIAVAVLLAGKHEVQVKNAGRYDGWYDSLGI